MSNFAIAITTVLKHEGGLVNNPNDPGGITNYGISLRYLIQLGHLDAQLADPHHNGQITAESIRKLTPADAMKIYQSQWWDHYRYGAIINQFIATKVFDLAVNMDGKHAHRLLQRACWSVKGQVLAEPHDDGILGPVTLTIVNSLSPDVLLPALRSEAAGFYRALNKPEFEKGWLARAYD